MYCIYIVYKTFYVVFIHFYCKDIPTAFVPVGGLMCPPNKKTHLRTTIRPRFRVLIDLFLSCAHEHSTEIYGPFSFHFLLYTTIRPRLRVHTDFFVFYLYTAIRPNYMTLFHILIPKYTTIRPKIKVFTDIFLSFAHDHSTKIYDLLFFFLYD